MMLFALLGGLLIFLALILIVPPLLRHKPGSDREFLNKVASAKSDLAALKVEFKKGRIDESEYQAKRLSLGETMLDGADDPPPSEQEPLRGRWAGAATAVFIPAIALGMYLQIGKPDLIDGSASPAPHQATAGQQQMPPIEEMIGGLEKKLEEDPGDSEGWFMLGRAYMLTKNYPKAVEAMQKTLAITGDDPDILMRLADAMAMRNDGRISGEPAELIKRSLAINPDHGEALWLAGIAAQEVGNAEEAIKHWQRAKKSLASDPDSLAMLDQAIESIQAEGSGASEVAAQQNPSTETQSTPTQSNQPLAISSNTAASVTVTISLHESIKEQANPEDTVFIFAKAASGPPMPLAAQRGQVKDLPMTVTLDDSQAMMPNLKLSGFDRVVVGARISRSGSPIGQSGDLEGLSAPLKPKAGLELSVEIDQIKP